MVLGLLFASAATLGAAWLLSYTRIGDGTAKCTMYFSLLFGYAGGDAVQERIMHTVEALTSVL